MKDNLVLIGMPGVGKSTAGVVAAKLAGYQFLDTDLVITQHDGRLLREIYEERKDLYEKFADHIIDVDEQSIEATAQELAKIARNG